MARLLVPEQFGALAIMLAFVNISNVIVQSGFNTALVQNPDTDDDDCSTVLWLSLGISVLLYSVVFSTAPLIASFYCMDSIIWPLRLISLILIINSYYAVQVAIVQRALEFRKIFNATIASVLVSGCAGIGMALLGCGLWALVGQQLSYQFMNCVVLAIQVPWKPKIVFKVSRAKILFGFSWKLLVSGLLDTGYRSLSDLIIGRQFSATSLGYVSQGKKYPEALGSMFDGAIQPVMLSTVSHTQNDISQVKQLVRRALVTSTYLVIPIMTLSALTAEPLIALLLGEQWLPCVPFLQMFCFTYALLPIHTSNLQALNGMGRSDIFLKLELIKKGYGVCLILFAAFVMRDIYAIVIAMMINGVISTFVNARPNKRVIGYSYLEQLRDIAPGFLLSFGSAVIAWPIALLTLPPIVTVVMQAVTMAVIYIFASKIFHIEAFDYLFDTLRQLIKSRIANRGN